MDETSRITSGVWSCQVLDSKDKPKEASGKQSS
ncbi:hypothetical protein AGR1C_Lc20152 [Agrobacterium fabacearum TT111]|nr:hypothetical protein AGR1C_Lc20152 [Agrobacterium fabacearum TT111]